VRLYWKFALVFIATVAAGQNVSQDSGQSVTGAYEGWYANPDGTFTMLVGYFNRNSKETLDIPVGPNNRIEPGGPDQGQPTHFLPRRQWGVFTITVPKDFGDKRLTWTITANGQTTSIPLNLNPLWVLSPFKDASGNAAPVVRLEAGGRSFAGPPRGIGQAFNAKPSEPLPLTAWVSDENSTRAQRGGGRGGAAPVSVSWSLLRGTGPVTFENPRPRPDADGEATTTAQFSAPGEYILRLQANNSTGEGGGGFQCCWTNVHVKVTVSTNAVAVEQEPQHKVVFKNDYVRIIDAQLPPGYATLNHRHDMDNVSVTISNGRDGAEGQRGVGRAGFSRGGYAHSVTNSNPKIMRFIVVEALKPERANVAAVDLPKHMLETENDRVRIYRVKITAGESLASHTHNSGWVEVVVNGDVPGRSIWHAAGENRPLAGGEIVEIEPK
jgi:hypothetical protein